MLPEEHSLPMIRQKTHCLWFVLFILFTGMITALCKASENPTQNAPAQPSSVNFDDIREPPGFDWNDAELALLKARKVDGNLDQKRSLTCWRNFLKREDLTKEMQAFAWYRTGCLLSHEYNASNDESPDYNKAEEAFVKVMELIPRRISFDTLESSTVFATLPGPPEVKADRLARSFQWLSERTEEEIQESAREINRLGYLLNKKFFATVRYRKDFPIETKEKFLRNQLASARDIVRRRITDYIQDEDNMDFVPMLLEELKGSADAEVIKEWQNLYEMLLKKAQQQPPPDFVLPEVF